MSGWTVTVAGRVERGRRGRVRPYLAVACLLGGLSASGVVLAEDKQASQAEDLPKAEVILDKWVEASGGKEALEKIHNRVTKQTFEILGMGVKADITLWVAAPNKSRMALQSQAIGKHEEGTDGTTFWEVSSMQGPRILEGRERAFMQRAAIFSPELHWRELYPKVECAGVEDVEGTSCYKMVMTPAGGDPETWYLNRETHLLAKVEITYPSQMGDILITIVPSDYRKVDGLMISHTSINKLIGQTRIITVTSVEHNVDIPADRFELPEDIKALLEKPDKPEKPKKPEKP